MAARLYAICSDVHANVEALKSVVRDARAVARRLDLTPPQWVFLGDVVDYGPEPNTCMRLVRDLGGLTIRGNHESAVGLSFDRPPVEIRRDYWPITIWTRHRLTETHRHTIAAWDQMLVGPPGLETFTLFHGSLTEGKDGDGRIQADHEARNNLDALTTPFGLFGHTHFQGHYSDGVGQPMLHLAHPADCRPTSLPRNCEAVPACSGDVDHWIRLPGHGLRAVINPGSVGQPRMHPVLRRAGVPHDRKAAYMLLRLNGAGLGEIQYRRVAYDLGRTIRSLETLHWSGLPREVRGSNVFKDSQEGNKNLPAAQLRDVLEHMPELLPALVKTVLVPWLREG